MEEPYSIDSICLLISSIMSLSLTSFLIIKYIFKREDQK